MGQHTVVGLRRHDRDLKVLYTVNQRDFSIYREAQRAAGEMHLAMQGAQYIHILYTIPDLWHHMADNACDTTLDIWLTQNI